MSPEMDEVAVKPAACPEAAGKYTWAIQETRETAGHAVPQTHWAFFF
jgi:hypothetical protein